MTSEHIQSFIHSVSRAVGWSGGRSGGRSVDLGFTRRNQDRVLEKIWPNPPHCGHLASVFKTRKVRPSRAATGAGPRPEGQWQRRNSVPTGRVAAFRDLAAGPLRAGAPLALGGPGPGQWSEDMNGPGGDSAPAGQPTSATWTLPPRYRHHELSARQSVCPPFPRGPTPTRAHGKGTPVMGRTWAPRPLSHPLPSDRAQEATYPLLPCLPPPHPSLISLSNWERENTNASRGPKAHSPHSANVHTPVHSTPRLPAPPGNTPAPLPCSRSRWGESGGPPAPAWLSQLCVPVLTLCLLNLLLSKVPPPPLGPRGHTGQSALFLEASCIAPPSTGQDVWASGQGWVRRTENCPRTLTLAGTAPTQRATTSALTQVSSTPSPTCLDHRSLKTQALGTEEPGTTRNGTRNGSDIPALSLPRNSFFF